MDVFVGVDPIAANVLIPYTEFSDKLNIKIKDSYSSKYLQSTKFNLKSDMLNFDSKTSLSKNK